MACWTTSTVLVESVIGELREGIWRPLLPTVIILGAVWLGWYGLIRKRVTLTIESAVWMVLATTLGIWILVNPAQILGYASTVVNAGGKLINSALSRISVPGASVLVLSGRQSWKKRNGRARTTLLFGKIPKCCGLDWFAGHGLLENLVPGQ